MKLRWFPLYRITVVLLMLALVIMVLLNFKAERVTLYSGWHYARYIRFGWPLAFSNQYDDSLESTDGYVSLATPGFSAKLFLIDFASWLSILFAVGLLCELTNRRREASKPLKRPWLQLHLSTLILLMLAASLSLWANVQLRTLNLNNAAFLFWDHMSKQYIGRGWPLVFDYDGNPEISYGALTVDCVVALVGLGFCCLVSEFLIRRREVRKA